MKKILSIVIFILAMVQLSWAYDFAYTYEGKTLFYNITSSSTHTVAVTYQNTSDPRYTNLSGEVKIPSTVTYSGTTYTVTSIGTQAFQSCQYITKVTIPSSVTSIGQHAFGYCYGLTTVNFNATNCTSMGSGSYPVFYSCSALTTLNIGSNVTNIPKYAFKGCSNLTGGVIIPNSVLSIGEQAFMNDSSILSITLGNSVTSIGSQAFQSCSRITSITIPSSVTSIATNAFGYCYGLTTVNFNATNCTSMGSSSYPVFSFCSALTTLNIGSNVTNIPEYAFYRCNSITKIYSYASVAPTVGGSYAFVSVPSSTPVYVPCGSSDSYYTRWTRFPNIIEYVGYSVYAISDNATQGSASVVTQPSCTSSNATIRATANTGYLFSHWSDGSTANPYTFAVCGTTTRAAYFVPIDYIITVVSDNSSFGSVSGGGTYPYSSQATITATPNQGCRFTEWNDGNTSNPRTVTVTGNATYTAYFTNQHTITVLSNNQEYGTVAGGGSYVYNTTATISAAPNQGYEFTQWNDGNTANPRTVTVTDSATYTAIFTPINYNIIVNSGNSSMGSTTGGGMFPYNSQTSISATPNEHYMFTQWNDGNTSNPRTITILGDATYTAQFAIQTHSITVLPNNQSWGTTTGGGTYEYGYTATITATPNEHYVFTQWNDGNTSNPRTITVSGNATYTATFAPVDYTITVNSENTTMGSVSGSGSFPYNSQTTISAISNYGYGFTQWNDGNTSNPRTITITGEATYTASFAPLNYTITVSSNSQEMGIVAGGGLYEYNTTATISATPNQGYEFTQWNDGNTANPRTVTVTENATYTATFTPINYAITVNSENPTMGSASGSGTFPYDSQTTISATPNYGYEFTQWNDGNTANPRTVTISGDATYTASFVPLNYTIIVEPNSNTMGTTSGSGSYAYNTTATISATANQGYRFTQWSDGNTSNPRTVTVTGNAAYTATFVPIDYTITVNSEDQTMGTASGGGTFPYNSQTTITATPNDGYEFRQWSDGNTSNPRTITVTGNATYTAQFSLKNYTITVNSHNNSMGTTTGSGTYEYGTSVTISAEPKSGFAFDYWGDDHSASRIRTVAVTGNATYTAYFRQIPAGISSVETDNYNISTLGNRIVITTSGDEPVYVYDITGRLVSKTRPQGGELSVQVPQLGVYMVKVGNSPAHKVVVR